MNPPTRITHVTFPDALRKGPPPAGNLAVPIFFLFVPAGQIHRFENFSSDFAVWVVFYGPEGGEPP
jgi:hypothetical protein